MIRVSDVRKAFRSGEEEVEALRGVSFEVQRGTGLFIVGPSGSGKSTLLYLLGALDNPTSGTIVIDGANITAMDEVQGDVFRRGKIGFVFQQFNLIPNLSAVDNVLLPYIPTGRHTGMSRESRGALAAGRARQQAASPAVPALGRPAAAGGDRAGPDQGPGRPPRRRADWQPRPKRGRRDLRAHPRATEEPRLHARRRHPRPSIHPAHGSRHRNPGWAPRRLIRGPCSAVWHTCCFLMPGFVPHLSGVVRTASTGV